MCGLFDKLAKLKIPYELTMITLAIIAAVLVIKELTIHLTEEQLRLYKNVDLVVLIAFATDYFTRLYLAEDKKVFVKQHILELIAIIPFENIFRLARLVRLVRLFRLLRLFRALVILRRFYGTLFGILRTNGLQYVLAATLVIMIAGAAGVQYFERHSGHMESFGDALWWFLATVTTVGYGDISPSTAAGRVLAGFLMISGIGFIGILTATIATFFINQLGQGQTRKSLNDEVKELIKSRIDRIEDLTESETAELMKLIERLR